MTSTKLLNKPQGPFVVSTETAATGCLKMLGKESLTKGCMKHAAIDFGLSLIPWRLLRWLVWREVKKQHLIEVRLGRQEKKE
jgi:hypothetical protein